MFIHILGHSLFDCRGKSFWNQIWNFFPKKITAKLAQKCNYFLHYGWSNLCLLNTMQKKNPTSLGASVSETLFFEWPLIIKDLSSSSIFIQFETKHSSLAPSVKKSQATTYRGITIQWIPLLTNSVMTKFLNF